MKENTLGMKLLMAVVTLGVLAYFGIQGWRYLSDPLTTTLAYTYEVEESMDLSGYVVRQEQGITDGLMRKKVLASSKEKPAVTFSFTSPQSKAMASKL